MIDLSLSIKILLGMISVLIIVHLWLARRFQILGDRQVSTLRMFHSQEQPTHPPALIRDFVLRSCPSSQRCPETIRIHQTGEMRLSEQGEWIPFTATQDFAIQQPGFVWRARFRAAPRIKIRVVDSYVDGHGYLEARLFGSISLAKAEGAGTDKGELMRYLAELVFCPDALLNNSSLQWRELDPSSVEVAAGPERAAVRFDFDLNGNIVRSSAPDRPRLVEGQEIETPWFGTFADYKVLGGYRIPTRGEVSWLLEDGPFCYWRGRITQLDVDPEGDSMFSFGSLNQPLHPQVVEG
ncbi:hypothetical protein C1752_07885 [Acaryochloris thomasi RCC1774]|uniref:Uncharacterized protein n=1 Tax=Acaryochloris thomasi RCC1774 TaxID=1764569 RepID=A0A2W1JQG4_9CYAN|nr:DUF6544 family protein [Acaryochloris thomasi]PZD71157.1 hypothetical protein C1752_07885 [Acaryochloris thomasi RCC1774]